MKTSSCLFYVLLWLCACGPAQEDRGLDSADGGQTPVSGGTITIAVDSDPGTLNAIIRTTALAGSILGVLNDGLAEMNEQLEFVPRLARNWTWSDDGLTLTYHLRDDVKWSDGEPFDSRDVLRSYELYNDPAVPTPRRSNFRDVEEVSAPNDSTIVFRFSRRSPEQIFNTAFPLIAAHSVEGLDPERIQEWPVNRKPVSNGAYRVKEWVAGERIVLERNPHYWDQAAYLESVVFKIVPEESSRLLQLEIGEVDMIGQVPSKDVQRLDENPDVRIYQLGPRYLGYLVYNLRRPDLEDARVRNAISWSIDRRALIDGLMFGYAERIANPISPIIGWAYHEELEPHSRDVDRARRLLTEAGWEDSDGDGLVDREGEPLRIEIKTRTGDPVRENGVLILQRNLREVGIEAQPRLLELSTVLDQVRAGDFDVYMGQVSARLSPDLSTSFATGGGFNYGGYSNAEVDSLIAVALAQLDRDAAARTWRQVQEILYREQPMSLLYAKYPLVGIRSEIRGATPNFLSIYENIDRWWRAPREP